MTDPATDWAKAHDRHLPAAEPTERIRPSTRTVDSRVPTSRHSTVHLPSEAFLPKTTRAVTLDEYRRRQADYDRRRADRQARGGDICQWSEEVIQRWHRHRSEVLRRARALLDALTEPTELDAAYWIRTAEWSVALAHQPLDPVGHLLAVCVPAQRAAAMASHTDPAMAARTERAAVLALAAEFGAAPPTCATAGCGSPVRSAGHQPSGRPKWGRLCAACHRWTTRNSTPRPRRHVERVEASR